MEIETSGRREGEEQDEGEDRQKERARAAPRAEYGGTRVCPPRIPALAPRLKKKKSVTPCERPPDFVLKAVPAEHCI